MSLTFNATLPQVGPSFAPPGADDFPAFGFKHASLDFVRARATPYVRRVVDAVALEGRHRFVCVEVRPGFLARGRVPGLPGWHVDTVGDPRHASRPEVHHLFVSGTTSLTEFLGAPVELDVPDGLGPHALMRALGARVDELSPPLWRVPSATLCTYGRFHLHRATPAREDERRLLVRVTETDVLRPHDRKVPVG